MKQFGFLIILALAVIVLCFIYLFSSLLPERQEDEREAVIMPGPRERFYKQDFLTALN